MLKGFRWGVHVQLDGDDTEAALEQFATITEDLAERKSGR